MSKTVEKYLNIMDADYLEFRKISKIYIKQPTDDNRKKLVEKSRIFTESKNNFMRVARSYRMWRKEKNLLCKNSNSQKSQKRKCKKDKKQY